MTNHKNKGLTRCGTLQREGASRDVLLLDIALDNYFRLCLERTDKAALGGDALCDLIELVLRNTIIAYDSKDFRQVWLPALIPARL